MRKREESKKDHDGSKMPGTDTVWQVPISDTSATGAFFLKSHIASGRQMNCVGRLETLSRLTDGANEEGQGVALKNSQATIPSGQVIIIIIHIPTPILGQGAEPSAGPCLGRPPGPGTSQSRSRRLATILMLSPTRREATSPTIMMSPAGAIEDRQADIGQRRLAIAILLDQDELREIDETRTGTGYSSARLLRLRAVDPEGTPEKFRRQQSLRAAVDLSFIFPLHRRQELAARIEVAPLLGQDGTYRKEDSLWEFEGFHFVGVDV